MITNPTVNDLDRMCDAMIASIPDRGQEDNASTIKGSIIRTLFNTAKADPDRALTWWDLWKECWPEEYEYYDKHRKWEPKNPSFTYGQKVRSAVAGVRKFVDNFPATPKGKQFSFRACLPPGVYRLEFSARESDFFQSAVMKPIERQTTIGLLFGRDEEWFQGDLIAGAERQARKHGYRLVVAFTPKPLVSWQDNLGSEQAHLEDLSKQCAGLIVVPSVDEYIQEEEFAKPYKRLLARKYPFVFVERRVGGCEAPLVTAANERGGELATDYLLSDCHCQSVLVVVEAELHGAVKRLEGHLAFMRRLRGPDYAAIATTDDEVWESERHWHNLLARELEAHTGPVGVFTTNDWIAKQVRQHVDRMGVSFTERVHIIGFGGMEFMRYMQPPMVSIHQDFDAMGSKAAELVAKLAEAGDSQAERIELTHRVGVRYVFDFNGWAVRDHKLPSLQGTEPGDFLR